MRKRKARLYQATWRDSKGRKRKSGNWYVDFRDHLETIRRMPLYSDKEASRAAAVKIEELVNAKRARTTPPPEITQWMEGLPDRIRLKLGKFGLVSSELDAASKHLSVHLDDFERSLTAKNGGAEHARRVAGRARRLLLDDCRFETYGEIKANRVEGCLSILRQGTAKKRGLSPRTSNFYLLAVKQFCGWMVARKQALSSPLACLAALKESTVRAGRRHERRPLSDAESLMLLTKTESGPVRGNMPGPERALLYRLAAETGLRASELRSLTRASFALDKKPPVVTVKGRDTKNDEEAELPLRPDTVEVLRAHLADKLPAAKAFGMPSHNMNTIFRKDLKAAGVCYREADGRYADFHALRYTFGTNLARGGVHPKKAQDLMRHGDIRLTMNLYTHTVLEDRADAVAKLPDLAARAQEIAKAAVGAGEDEGSPESPPGGTRGRPNEKSQPVQSGPALSGKFSTKGNGRRHDSASKQRSSAAGRHVPGNESGFAKPSYSGSNPLAASIIPRVLRTSDPMPYLFP